MKLFPNAFLALLACSLVGHTSPLGQIAAGSPQGRWDAALTLNQTAIPFRLDVSADGSSITGTLFNGGPATCPSLED